MKKRTLKIKAAMVKALEIAIDYLHQPDMPTIPNYEEPLRYSDFLQEAIDAIQAPGPIKNKKYLLYNLQAVADYFNHPKVWSLPFAIRTSNLASSLREMIRDLK